MDEFARLAGELPRTKHQWFDSYTSTNRARFRSSVLIGADSSRVLFSAWSEGRYCRNAAERSEYRRSLPDALPLELPRREAPDVDMELVETAATFPFELDLELVLMLGNGQAAHGAFGADARASPRTGR